MTRFLDPAKFTAEKLSWQRLVLQDPSLNAFAKVLAAFLMHSLHEKRGAAWMSQTELAANLGVDVRTIRRATADLVVARWLVVTVSKGRGRSNVYRAILGSGKGEQQHQQCDSECGLDSREMRTAMSDASHKNWASLPNGQWENRTSLAQNTEGNRTGVTSKADRNVLPIHIETNSPLPPTAGAVGTESSFYEFRARAQGATSSAGTKRFPDGSVRGVFLAAKGRNFVWSYLDQALWNPSDRIVICATKFAAQKLRTECGAELLKLGLTVTHSGSETARTTKDHWLKENYIAPVAH